MRFTLTLALALLGACDSPSPLADGGSPATDAAAPDAGVMVVDAGGPDAGALDAGVDAGPPPDPTFCVGKLNGDWCDGADLVTCRDDVVASRSRCEAGCEVQPPGTPDVCRAVPFCDDVPATAEASPPTSACNYMDWELSTDGYYLISRFGTTNDSTTLGRSTTCGFLQSHYDGRGCVYDNQSGGCVATDPAIPWVQGHVDYDYDSMLTEVRAHLDGDVPTADYFYVAGAQRFGCGATLRVSNSDNGRCVVVYAEDGGPGERYEEADRGGRRILDASPAVVEYLGVTRWGWASSTMMLVEWGLPGDVPGHACTPCGGTPVAAGTEARRPIHDPDHMMPTSCR
jgi:hypothetical protein